MKYYLYTILVICSFLFKDDVLAQCNSLVTTLPYTEDFETSDGNWVTGGNASDWTWGTPLKSIITGAGSGLKCWITGGLTGNSYNNSEQAWVQSPCFNFTNIQHPFISFKVFWETEYNYDGAVFQYSTDSGKTWQNAGSVNDAQDCLNTNWFNTPGIRYLAAGNGEGWSGSVADGNGSKSWVMSQHLLNDLAGKPSVAFRFFFGAGVINNDYNGFAFDDFSVSELPAAQPDFTYTCAAANAYQFNYSSSSCPTSFQWNFGDAASGSSDSSAITNPVHTFSNAGNYTISLTVVQQNISSTITKKIKIINASVAVVNRLNCYGDTNAAAAVTVSSAGIFTFVWSTVPPQTTDTATSLAAGNYTVQISDTSGCPVVKSITVKQPDSLTVQAKITRAICTSASGSITLKTGGGSLPYRFLWLNDSTTSGAHQSLVQGSYVVKITDAANCMLQDTFTVKSYNPLDVSLGKDTGICNGETLLLNPGAYNFYRWQDNSSASTYLVKKEGIYGVLVGDTNGCTATDSIKIYTDCGGIYFPSAFTPNGDGLNDLFGPIGNLSNISKYELMVYNRWGNLVFSSYNPNKKFTGKPNGEHDAVNTFTWFAKFTYNGAHLFKKRNGYGIFLEQTQLLTLLQIKFMTGRDVYIVAAVRTPIGSFGGALKDVSATQLGAIAIKAAVKKAGLQPSGIEEVMMGCVLQANLGQAPARQASMLAGLPENVISSTINKVCASGMKAIMLAAQNILLGDADVMVAGGMESMSNVPFYSPKLRWGNKFGDVTLVDGLQKDGLTDVYKNYAMGNAAELCAATCGISREQQDAFAIESYTRSQRAWNEGLFDEEVVAVEIPQRGGALVLFAKDEEPFNVKFDKIAALKPAFEKEGTVTAANASTLNDGAAAVVLMSKEKADSLGIKPLAVIKSFADAEQAPEWFTTTPSLAVPKAIAKAGLQISDIDFFELNEAFSVVGIVNTLKMQLDPQKVNVHGGAVALGHPLGCSGARIMVTLINILKQNNAKFGAAGICNGGGGASAMVIENPFAH